jgi:release factor glutamine methyltransferase
MRSSRGSEPTASRLMTKAEPFTIAAILRAAEAALHEAGVPTPKGDAQWIAAEVLGVPRSALLAHDGDEIHDGQHAQIIEMVSRRAKREPLAYVLGTGNFRGLALEVGAGCLVPRPETETTAERAIWHARERGLRPTVVDVGTGCGAIALSIAAEVPNARVFATELSPAARAWALRNLARTGLRVTLLPGDLLDPLHPALGGAVDIVVSNPPYLRDDEWDGLEPEVRHEPREAVIAGEDGLEVVMRLLEDVNRWLSPGGWLVLELAPDQAERLAKLLGVIGYDHVLVTKDLAGRERVVEGRWVGV